MRHYCTGAWYFSDGRQSLSALGTILSVFVVVDILPCLRKGTAHEFIVLLVYQSNFKSKSKRRVYLIGSHCDDGGDGIVGYLGHADHTKKL